MASSASRSPYTDLMSVYVEAEAAGKEGGDCDEYFAQCPHSLFNKVR